MAKARVELTWAFFLRRPKAIDSCGRRSDTNVASGQLDFTGCTTLNDRVITGFGIGHDMATSRCMTLPTAIADWENGNGRYENWDLIVSPISSNVFPPPVGPLSRMEKEINVLALVKGEEKFVFLFDDSNRDQTLRQLARFAANPELDFSWYDAAMLSRKIREAVPVEDDLLIDSEMDNLSLEDFS